ncbi:hypothetical protein ACWEFL_02560 [Streptomyces sp. NPDC004838]
MTTPIELSFVEAERLRVRGRQAVETESCVYGLPIPGLTADYDAVRIRSTDTGVLARWLEVRGGTVTVTEAGDRFQVWTLRTGTLAEPGWPSVLVLVSVLVPWDEPVLEEIRDAMSAAAAAEGVAV